MRLIAERIVKCYASEVNYLTAFHFVQGLLWDPRVAEMVEIVKDRERSSRGNDAGGDEGYSDISLKGADHDVQGDQEYHNGSGQQHHAIGERFAKRNHCFLLFNS